MIFFGLPEGASAEEDLSTVQSFLTERMSLQWIQTATYRLGSPSSLGARFGVRPIAVRFRNIQDWWLVWNQKGTITFVPNSPVWLHEDLPKQLIGYYRRKQNPPEDCQDSEVISREVKRDQV